MGKVAQETDSTVGDCGQGKESIMPANETDKRPRSVSSLALSGKLTDEDWEALAEELRRNPQGPNTREYLLAFAYGDLEKYRTLHTQFLLSDDMVARSEVAGNLFALQNAMELFVEPAIKVIEALPEKSYSYYTRENRLQRDFETSYRESHYIIYFNTARKITIDAAGEYLAEQSEPRLIKALIKVVENPDDNDAIRRAALNALALAVGLHPSYHWRNPRWYSLKGRKLPEIMRVAKTRLQQETASN